MSCMRKGLIPLRVHCWGGLGSQLFAVILYVELKKKFPNKRIILCLHESGVTKRNSEIDGIFKNILTEEFKDFSKSPLTQESEEKIQFKDMLKVQLKRVLIRSRVLLTLDESVGIDSVKPWTVSIRGHYSYRKLDSDSVRLLLSSLTNVGMGRFSDTNQAEMALGVHYRLGDLLELSTKQPMGIQRLSRLIKERMKSSSIESIIVFSDSPAKAHALLVNEIPQAEIAVVDVATWETIGILSKSQLFVGTFSKVSLWVVIFRYFSEIMMPSYMPMEARSNLELILGAPLDSAKIHFYN